MDSRGAYLMDNGRKTRQRSRAIKVLGVVGAVFFFLSYIPFLILVLYAQDGAHTGLWGGRTVYGWEAVTTMFPWFCIIPIFPVCIIFQIVFGIFYIRRKNKGLKIASAVMAAATIVAIAIPCIAYIPKEKARIEELEPEVRSYLAQRYGEELSKDAKLSLYEYDTGTFQANSKVLPGNIRFELDHAPDGYYDDLINAFSGQNPKYDEGFRNYLDDLYDLPENMHSQPHIEKIDFTGYKNGDDTAKLYPKTDYQVAGVMVRLDHEHIVQDELIRLAMEAVNDITPKFEGHKLGHFMVYVKDIDFDETAASIQIDFPCADTMNYTVVQIEPRIYDDMPDTIWEDGFFAEEMNDVGTIN